MRFSIAGGLLAALALLAAPGAGQQRNVLLLIADDLGVDRVGAYAAHPDPGRTPVIDALAAGGMLFRNAWSNPNCPPTRAGMLTGRHSVHSGFVATDFWTVPTELPLAETTIPEALPANYRSAVVGKWHIGSLKATGYLHPLLQGFDNFRGSMTIFTGSPTDNYTNFTKVVDGTSFVQVTKYATSDQVDDALSLINGWGGDPWFLWLAFHAPHGPFHKPPASLHTYGPLPNPISANIPLHMKAMAEAMDTEIGRLLAGIPPAVRANTVVIFLGDNGTDKVATTAPYLPSHAKGTVYQGGVNVPFIVNGPGVLPGSECGAIVSTTDVFATTLELAGVVNTTGEDSVSLVPYFTDPALPSLRDTVYTEIFSPNGNGPYTGRARAVRDDRYKLMILHAGSAIPSETHFFDLLADPFELNDLLAGPPLTGGQQLAYDALAALLAEPVLPWHVMTYTGAPGSFGLPQLAGTGTLLPNSGFTMSLSGAAPSASAGLVVGFGNAHLAFKGGVLATAPTYLLMMPTDAFGDVNLAGHWPAGLPAGAAVLFQFWIADAGAPAGWAGSNGLAAIGP